jgi:pilus assembly protein Flp/PilA
MATLARLADSALERADRGAASRSGIMMVLFNWLQQVRDEKGQGLAEYALILALIAVIAIAALVFLGGQISDILDNIGSSI